MLKLNSAQNRRLKKMLAGIAFAVSVGFCYCIFIRITGVGIPCPIYTVTGYKCASCGVTRMLYSLFMLDVRAAYNYNPVLFCMIPLFAVGGVRFAVRYVKYNNLMPTWFENIIIIVMISVLIIYAVLRNFS